MTTLLAKPIKATGNFRLGVSAETASHIFQGMGKAMAAIDFPPLPEIAIMRIADIKNQYGYYRFFIAEWWKWQWISEGWGTDYYELTVADVGQVITNDND